MDKKFYTDDFERLLKEKSDDFRMIPSRRVWHSIYNDLHPSRRWPSVAMSLLLIGALLFTGYLNTRKNSDKRSKDASANSGNQLAANKDNTPNSITTDVKTIAPVINMFDESSSANNTVGSPQSSNRRVDLSVSNNIDNTLQQNSANTRHTQARSSRITTSPVNHSVADGNISSPIAAVTGRNNRNTRPTGTPNSVAINHPANNDNTAVTPGEINDAVAATDLGDNNKTTIVNTTAQPNTIVPAANVNAGNTADQSKDKLAPNGDEKKASVSAMTAAVPKDKLATDQKAWMEDYALHNKPILKKWKGKLSWEIYATPSVTYRAIANNSDFPNNVFSSFAAGTPAQNNTEGTVTTKPGPSIELGANIYYAFSKGTRLRTGLHVNATRYNIEAWESSHPVLAIFTFNDPNSGYPYQLSKPTSLSTTSGNEAKKLHSQTYQVSAVVGLDKKLYGNDRIEWYAGVNVQPSYVFGGKAYIVSADKKNLLADKSMISKFNLAGGFETYVSYKAGKYTWQVGPSIRYQFLNTYDKKYTQKENLYSAGIKVGVVRLF